MSDEENASACLANLANASTCLLHGVCKVRNETYSTCACIPGRTGPTCEDLLQPLTWVYIADGLFFLFMLVFWISLAVRRYRQTKGKDFENARFKGVLSSRPHLFGPKLILLYRLVVFGFIFGVHMSDLPQRAPDQYKFYTVWNFIVLIVYFGIGLGLSLFTVIKGHEAIESHAYWRFNANLHYLLLEIELPNTLIVDAVTWGILFPNCGSPCGLVSFLSLVQHMANFFFIFGDFLLTRHAFDRHHFPFNLALPTFYAIFHLFFSIANDHNGHQFVYFFMDSSTPMQPLWILGVLFIHIALFFIVWAISTFIFKRKLDNVFDEDEPLDNSKAIKVVDEIPPSPNELNV